MKLLFKSIYLCFSLLLFTSSCKKETDNIPPTIRITAPVEGQTLSVDSGLVILATVFDNEIVKTVIVRLYDTYNNEFVNGSRTVNVNKSSDDLIIFYDVNDEFISSRYKVELTASDGENERTTSVDVRLNYTGYQFTGSVFASSSSNSTQLRLSTNNGAIQGFGQQSISCAGIAIDKKKGNYIILERLSPTISGYSILDNSLQWTNQMNPSGGNYQFSMLREIDETLYCLSFENKVYKFDINGQAKGIISTTNQPLEIKKIGNFLYTIEKRINDQTYYIGQYGVTGAFVSNRELNMEAIGLEEAGSNNVYILGNKNGVGRLMEYKVIAGALNFITNFNYSISSSFSYNNKMYFNSTDNGNLYEYSLNLTNGILKSRNIYADKFYIDETSNIGMYNHYQNGNAYVLDLSSLSGRLVTTFPSKVNAFSAYYKK